MRGATRIVWGLLGLVIISGCRTAARVIEMPRVDLALESGNRGYLAGTPPSPSDQRTTRQMMGADVEIPSFYKAKPSGRKVGLEDVLSRESEPSDTEEMAAAPMAGPALFDAYTVQKGDTLWSIAAKPEVYGNANHWRRIFEANRELLKSPDRVRVGMTLKIPRGSGGEEFPADEDEGMTFKK
ncbi:MAG: hypothetical protein COV75_06035 [Candidatus Omnitrophica bacterium CG11_big_fil_rev_8_21_14_0_20_63_9]|nr:MAG: hypothetical protein COV75_06035 [Candidatus Omnitrophica bacterium CG11_big_fil_rev_8_21_14_0_20_63_9]